MVVGIGNKPKQIAALVTGADCFRGDRSFQIRFRGPLQIQGVSWCGEVRLPAFALADDGYLVLHNGRVYYGSDWMIEADETGLPIGDAAEANDLRRELERMRTEMLNLTSENKRLRSDLDQKAVVVADLSARVDDATRRAGHSDSSGTGVKSGENPAPVAALVDRINRLEGALTATRQENERLKGA